jgi:hypothetical protein
VPLVLVAGAAVIAFAIVRNSAPLNTWRSAALVAGVALSARLAAAIVIQLIAAQKHPEGTWLNDESSFYLAAESLLPHPFDRPIRDGLEHLAGSGYLGLITALAQVVGLDVLAFRVVNATLGTLTALLSMWIAHHYFGRSAGLVAGLLAAAWPTLVLWSATMLRDTLGGFAVIGVWWVLATDSGASWINVRRGCIVLVAVVLIATLRSYLAAAAVAGVVAWAAYPLLCRLTPRAASLLAVGVCALIAVVLIQHGRQVDDLTHQLLYQQTATRIETLGRLYNPDPEAPTPEAGPFGPGTPVALVDPHSGWLLAGLVQDRIGSDVVSVAFTDESIRIESIADLVPLQSAPIPPLQLGDAVLASLGSLLTGIPAAGAAISWPWVIVALAWDVLFGLAVWGGVRTRLNVREWLYPACIVLATMAALSAVPGAPGNADRHRSTQTVPLLVVLAAGLFSSRLRSFTEPEASARGKLRSLQRQ